MNSTVMSMLDGITQNLVRLSWQITIVFFVVMLISVAFYKASPSFKYILWSMIVLRALVPVNSSILSLLPPFTDLPAPQFKVLVESVQTVNRLISADFPTSVPVKMSFMQIFWLSGFLLYLTAIISWIIYSRQYLNKSEKIQKAGLIELVNTIRMQLSIKQKIHVYYLHNSIENSPTITGIFKLKLYLPREIVDTWELNDIEPVIMHELVHANRKDILYNWVQIIVQAVFFFHPVIWYANSKIRYYREVICDDVTINLIKNKRKKYSQSILNVLELVSNNKKLELSTVYFSERKSSLARRVIRLSNKKYRFYQPLHKLSLALLCFIAVMGYTISCEMTPDELIVNSPNTSTILQMDQKNAADWNEIRIHIINENEYEIRGVIATFDTFEEVLKNSMLGSKKDKIIFYPDKTISAVKLQELTRKTYHAGANMIMISRIEDKEFINTWSERQTNTNQINSIEK